MPARSIAYPSSMMAFDSAEYDASNSTDDYYDYSAFTPAPSVAPTLCTDVPCVLLAIANVIIMLLGITGNGLVIWIAGFKIKKTVNTIWYLSLAVSNFLFCVFLPVTVVYFVKGSWVFGRFMCKLVPFVMVLNMLNSIFVLLLISVDRCVVVMFPVWAQNKRNKRRALVMVLLAWIFSVLLSLPALIFREIMEYNSIKICYNNYTHDKEHITVVVRHFIFGFAIPLLIINICYAVINRKLKNNQMASSNKPFKVMTALIVAFFISWIPYHFFRLWELNQKDAIVINGKKFASTLASANSFMNPLLYAFIGKDFKKKCYALPSKIENAFEEEAKSTLRGTSVTNTGNSKQSNTFV